MAGVILHDNWHMIANVIGPLGTALVLLIAFGLVLWIGWRRWSDHRATTRATEGSLPSGALSRRNCAMR